MPNQARFNKKIFFGLLLAILSLHAVISISALGQFFRTATLSGDQQLSRHFGRYYDYINFIKRATPEDSLILIPLMKREEWLADHEYWLGQHLEYFIFPRSAAPILKDDSARINAHIGPVYRVVMQDYAYAGNPLKEIILDKDFKLVLVKERTGKAREGLVNFSDIKSSFSKILISIAYLILIFLLGMHVVARYFEERCLPGFIASSFLVGAMIVTVLYIILGFAGIKLTEKTRLLYLLILALPSVFHILKKPGLMFSGRPKRFNLAVAIAGIVLFAIFLKSILTPIFYWDACSIWGLKAKAIFASNGLSCLKLWGVYPHYPPLVPVLMSQAACAGEIGVKCIFFLFSFCLYAYIYDSIKETNFSSSAKILLPLLVFTIPLFLNQTYNGYADLIFSAIALKAFNLMKNISLTEKTKSFFAFSLMSCVFVLIRPEGAPFYIFMVLIYFINAKKINFMKSLFFLAVC